MRELSFSSLLDMAIAEGATSPDPGFHCLVYSTSLGKPIYWDGSAWSSVGAGGGIFSPTLGVATVDFGSHPGSNEAVVTVSCAVVTASKLLQCYISSDSSTSDHTSSDHRYFAAFVGLSWGNIVSNTSFDIYVRSEHKFSGTFKVSYICG